MRALVILAVVALVVIYLSYQLFATPVTAFRTVAPGPDCPTIALDQRNVETPEVPGAACFLQHHRVPTPENGNTWATLDGDDRILNPDSYHLSFVELQADGQEFELDGQLSGLQDHLKGNDQNVVIVYVHGWRHNAAIGNGNVRMFRTLLAYSRSFLNTRCLATREERYCDATLTGIYLGWRGKRIEEPENGLLNAMFTPVVAPSLWTRKPLSDRIATGHGQVMHRFFETLSQSLKLDNAAQDADKLLVVGHSLGGNILATHLADEAVRRVWEHKPGTEMAPLLGDLVVLLNPAAEAEKWLNIQRAERRKAGLHRDEKWMTYYDGAPGGAIRKQKIKAWYNAYPATQKPVYISLTATPGFNPADNKNDVKEDSDFATRFLFPLFSAANMNWGWDRLLTIGHYVPRYSSKNNLRTAAEGTSHDVDIHVTEEEKTHPSAYGNAGEPRRSWCQPADKVLSLSKKCAGGVGANWDWRMYPKGNKPFCVRQNWVGGEVNKWSVQFRASLGLDKPKCAKKGGNCFYRSVVEPDSPFWNVRANDTAIENHDGFVSYALWCGIHHLFLDPVADAP